MLLEAEDDVGVRIAHGGAGDPAELDGLEEDENEDTEDEVVWRRRRGADEHEDEERRRTSAPAR